MKLSRKLTGLIAFMAILTTPALAGCSEKAERISADEEAAQIEKRDSADVETAKIEGRNAAKEIITKNWTDTVELQQAILEARARNSRFEMNGESKSKAAYDSAFFATIRTVRPDLAKALDPKSK